MSLDNADNLEIDNLIDDNVEDQIDQSDSQDDNQQDDDELEISIDGEDEESQSSEEHSNESSTIKTLRRELRLAKQQLSNSNVNQTVQNEPEIVLGEKPTLEALDYDTDKYEAELAAYYDRQQKLKDIEANKAKQLEKIKEKQAKQVTAYNEQAKALKVKNFKEAEKEFVSSVSKEVGSAILRAADNKALVVYALGTNPNQLDRLSSITDPFRLAAEIGKFESKIKMNRKNTAPKPEQGVRGKVAPVENQTTDRKLAQLEKEAERTGDRSKVVAYKKSLRNK